MKGDILQNKIKPALGGMLRSLGNFPLLLRFVLLVLLPLACVVLWIGFHMRQGLPPRSEILHNAALSAPVRITRDADGVPQIEAVTDTDAYFAIGYVHAEDRLWQLELQRRLARGTVSEIFGKESLQQDIWFRTLGIMDAAKSAWPALSNEAKASLTAYTAGINAVIAERRNLPPEFHIMQVEPQPWTEIDSLAWIKVFAFNLGGNFRTEMSRFLARQALPADQAATFFPDYPADAPVTVAGSGKTSTMPATPTTADAAGLGKLLAFQRDLETRWMLGGRAVGSNAWAVAGSHTADGTSYLANDPHLGLQIPSLWYALRVKGGRLDVAGMTLVGLPPVVFGHNGRIAWGGTNMMADAQDLYLEHADAHDANAYESNGQAIPFTVRTEDIAIRADFPEALHRAYKPYRLHVRSTRHGPVISDQFDVFDHPVSLHWTALADGDTTYEAFFRLAYAADWDSFRAALQPMVAPALNLVYADRRGHIGYLGIGRIPIRKNGDGSTPAAGWNDEHEWTAYVPPAQWPSSYDPPSGFIVSANNKVVGPDYPYFISRDWASPARAERILEMLGEKTAQGRRLGLEDMEAMQGDQIDVTARGMMTALQGLSFTPQDERQRKAWDLLAGWHGDMSGNSAAASVFHSWMRHLRQRLFDTRLTAAWKTPLQAAYSADLGPNANLDTLARIVSHGDTPWCSNAKQPESGNIPACGTVLATALDDALTELEKLTGSHDPADWQWGKVQKTVYAHTPFSGIKPMDRVFEMRIGNGGSVDTVDVAYSQFVDKEGYLQRFGAGFRLINALGRDGISAYYMNSTGESGNVADPHYADMVCPFRDVHYRALDAKPAHSLP